MIEDDEDFCRKTEEIILYPPVNTCEDLTYEDSGDEFDLSLNNLPGSQLGAASEVKFHSDDEWSSDNDVPLSTLTKSSKHIRNNNAKDKKKYNWENIDLTPETSTFENETIVGNRMTPIDLFSLFFDDSLLQLILDKTEYYAQTKNRTQLIEMSELKAFLGVLILSGYVQLPRRRMFWEREKDAHNSLVSDAITRDKFEYILSNFHIVDNAALNQQDKFAKLRPLFEHLNKKFLELAPHEQDHSVDEAMVPYYGRHGCKQYIHGKPIRYGYKLWTGTTRLGYVIWFDPYQGASIEKTSDFGVGATVVLNYANVLQERWPNTAFHLYFDNYFTSVPLLEELSKRKLFGTGTVRENRLPGKPLLDNKVMKKQNRGYFDYQKIKGSNIIALKWNDNNIVCCLSNEAGVNPIHSTKRYSRKDKKIVQISQPHVISLYNRNMGGVDRSDENIAKYRISIRGKKWYFSLVSHCIDLAINNAWLLHRLWGGEHDLLKFRRSIAITMLSQHKKRKDYNRSHASATGN